MRSNPLEIDSNSSFNAYRQLGQNEPLSESVRRTIQVAVYFKSTADTPKDERIYEDETLFITIFSCAWVLCA